MTFFNPKEDVIKIQLTRYGRDALIRGQFQPYCYKFFDDEIIYDSKYSNKQEPQSLIQDRILNQAPRKIPGNRIFGVETFLNNNVPMLHNSRKHLIPSKVDEQLLLRDEILDGDPNKQEITHTEVGIYNEGATFDTNYGIRRTKGNYTVTKNYNIFAKNHYKIETVEEIETLHPKGERRNILTETPDGAPLTFVLDEDHDYLDSEEYEWSLFEIVEYNNQNVRETETEESLIPLVVSGERNEAYRQLSDFFIITVDDQIPEVYNSVAESRRQEDAINLDPRNQNQGGSDSPPNEVRNLYTDYDPMNGICED